MFRFCRLFILQKQFTARLVSEALQDYSHSLDTFCSHPTHGQCGSARWPSFGAICCCASSWLCLFRSYTQKYFVLCFWHSSPPPPHLFVLLLSTVGKVCTVSYSNQSLLHRIARSGTHTVARFRHRTVYQLSAVYRLFYVNGCSVWNRQAYLFRRQFERLWIPIEHDKTLYCTYSEKNPATTNPVVPVRFLSRPAIENRRWKNQIWKPNNGLV